MRGNAGEIFLLTIDSVRFFRLDLFNVWASSLASWLLMGCLEGWSVLSWPFCRKLKRPGSFLVVPDGYSPIVTLIGLDFLKVFVAEPLEIWAHKGGLLKYVFGGFGVEFVGWFSLNDSSDSISTESLKFWLVLWPFCLRPFLGNVLIAGIVDDEFILIVS